MRLIVRKFGEIPSLSDKAVAQLQRAVTEATNAFFVAQTARQDQLVLSLVQAEEYIDCPNWEIEINTRESFNADDVERWKSYIAHEILKVLRVQTSALHQAFRYRKIVVKIVTVAIFSTQLSSVFDAY